MCNPSARIVIAVTALLASTMARSSANAQALRQEIYAQWQLTDLGEIPGWFDFQSGHRQASFTGLVGARVASPGGDGSEFSEVAVLFDVHTGKWWVPQGAEISGSNVPEISPNGLALINVGGGMSAGFDIYNHVTGETISVRDGGHTPFITSEAISSQGDVALRDVHTPEGAADHHIWPDNQVVVLPNDAGFSQITSLSESRWIGGEYQTGQDSVQRAFRWHADHGFEVVDSGVLETLRAHLRHQRRWNCRRLCSGLQFAAGACSSDLHLGR
jgi:hypothetical protein